MKRSTNETGEVRARPEDGALGLALVFVVAALAHASALSGGWIWLDHAHIEEGLALAEPGSFASLFRQGFAGTGFYRPLMALSLSIDRAISEAPLFFRVVTLGWHALAATMTTLLARRFGCSPRAALLAGALFGVHPLTSLVADAVAFRSEAMITVALLSLLWAHLSSRPLLAAGSVLLGALSKETALVLAPLFVVTLEVGLAGAGDKRPRAKRLRLLGAELAAFACALALRLMYAPNFRAHHVDLSLSEQVGTRLAALARSTAAALVPIDSTICDATQVHSLFSGPALVGALALGAALYLAIQERPLGALFFLSLVPSFGLVPLMRFWSPHYLYLPLALGVTLGVRVLERHHPRLLPGIAALAALLALVSLSQGSRYLSDEALWTAEVEKRPSCLEGQFYLGEVAREKKDLVEAAERYSRALALRPNVLAYVDRSSALQNLGAVRFQLGQWDEARDAWTDALAVSGAAKEQRELKVNLAAVDLRRGHADAAVDLLEPELERPDALPEALYLAATALHQLGREGEAVQILRRLQRGPGAAERGPSAR